MKLCRGIGSCRFIFSPGEDTCHPEPCPNGSQGHSLPQGCHCQAGYATWSSNNCRQVVVSSSQTVFVQSHHFSYHISFTVLEIWMFSPHQPVVCACSPAKTLVLEQPLTLGHVGSKPGHAEDLRLETLQPP